MDVVIAVSTLVSLLGAALMAGVFYAFSTFVMKALAAVPASAGMAAMQSINIVVINVMFLGVFFTTALLSFVNIALVIYDWRAEYGWIALASAMYFAGTFFVTIAFNVPLNNKLASESTGDANALTVWNIYVKKWTRWNHVRTVAAITATAMYATGLLAI